MAPTHATTVRTDGEQKSRSAWLLVQRPRSQVRETLRIGDTDALGDEFAMSQHQDLTSLGFVNIKESQRTSKVHDAH